jgi:hypothetical protein
MRKRKHTVGVKVMLSEELLRALERAANELNVGKSTLLRLVITQYLKPWLSPSLQPQRLSASPVGPGARGLEVAGPETGGDEPQPLTKEKAGGGEGG